MRACITNLADIADTVRGYKRRARAQAKLALEVQQLEASAAMAIQLTIDRERGLAKNENPNQDALITDELTELVEEAGRLL